MMERSSCMLGLASPAIQFDAKHEGRIESANAGNLAKRLPLYVGTHFGVTTH
jgi:hypothetical protein